jgi:hypothetical protein
VVLQEVAETVASFLFIQIGDDKMANLKDFLNMLLKNTPFTVVGKGDVNISVGANMGMLVSGKWQPKWKIEKYNSLGKLYAIEEFAGNKLLDEGVNEMWKLIAGLGGKSFNKNNSYIGVGDGTTAASGDQTGLQGANNLYRAVDPTYPQVMNQTITYRATFGSGEAAWAWQEFTIANGDSDSAINICRKVENHSTKPLNDTWVISLSITLS